MNPADPRSVTFRLVDGLTLRGGYAGIGATDPDDYDAGLHPTILTGELDSDFDAYHVTLVEGATATLQGCTVTRGEAYVLPPYVNQTLRMSGGLFATESNVSLSDCRFVGNGGTWGGAIFQTDSAGLHITNCSFEQNHSSNDGGAIYQKESVSLQIANCSLPAQPEL